MRHAILCAEVLLSICLSIGGDTSHESNWGTVTIKGQSVTIDGHSHWLATGTIRDNGRMVIQWVERDSGRVGPGSYELRDGHWVGVWGWLDEVNVLDNGTLAGSIKDDTIRKLER